MENKNIKLKKKTEEATTKQTLQAIRIKVAIKATTNNQPRHYCRQHWQSGTRAASTKCQNRTIPTQFCGYGRLKKGNSEKSEIIEGRFAFGFVPGLMQELAKLRSCKRVLVARVFKFL